jgi:hypothetical protein
MKTLTFAFSLLATSMMASAGDVRIFHGEISDTQCAMNIHSLTRSHQEMIKKQTFGRDAASCAKECVRRGGEWALRNGDEVYHLKNQEGVGQFAGQKVKLTGTLDRDTHTIDNLSIEVLPGEKASTW